MSTDRPWEVIRAAASKIATLAAEAEPGPWGWTPGDGFRCILSPGLNDRAGVDHDRVHLPRPG